MVYDHSDFLQTFTVLASILLLVILTIIFYKFISKNIDNRSGSKIYALLAITFLGNFVAKIVFIDFEIIFFIDIYLFSASVHGCFITHAMHNTFLLLGSYL